MSRFLRRLIGLKQLYVTPFFMVILGVGVVFSTRLMVYLGPCTAATRKA